MNATEIWSGQDYAYVDYISRGVSYYNSARPVRILRKFKQKNYDSERGRTMCEVLFLVEDDDGKLTPGTYTDGREVIREVRARNIYAHWEEHVRERTNYRAKQAETERIIQERRERERQEYERREEVRRQELEARQARERARKAHEEAETQRFLNYLEFKGIPRDVINSINGDYVYLDRIKLNDLVGFTPRPFIYEQEAINVA